VLTHGFVVDEDGRKMSKSLGNTVAPQDVIQQSGAEILRLWVAMVDYREEIRLGKQILARVVEAYRKIRNTARYLVSNLYDFDPAVDRLPVDQLEEVDRFMLARYAHIASQIVSAYEEYDFPAIFQAVNSFSTVELSALYSDISKDRLYTFAARSRERRSAQTAMYTIADGLTRLLAPILPVTADELWRHLPGNRETSVHVGLFPTRDTLNALRNTDLEARWARLVALRERVLAEIEPLRRDKHIGSSLQARVVLSASPQALAFPGGLHARELPMLFISPRVELKAAPADVEDPRRSRSADHDRAEPVEPSANGAGGTCRLFRTIPHGPVCASVARKHSPSRPMADPVRVRRRLELWLPIAIIAVDQLTKALIRASLRVYESVSIIPGFMDFTHVRNTGAAFGMLDGADFPLKTTVIAVIATAALVGVGFYSANLAAHQLLARIGLALIVGGAAGTSSIASGSVRSWISSTSTGARIISGHSTSPIRQFRLA
jgi:hypothetical protein